MNSENPQGTPSTTTSVLGDWDATVHLHEKRTLIVKTSIRDKNKTVAEIQIKREVGLKDHDANTNLMIKNLTSMQQLSEAAQQDEKQIEFFTDYKNTLQSVHSKIDQTPINPSTLSADFQAIKMSTTSTKNDIIALKIKLVSVTSSTVQTNLKITQADFGNRLADMDSQLSESNGDIEITQKKLFESSTFLSKIENEEDLKKQEFRNVKENYDRAISTAKTFFKATKQALVKNQNAHDKALATHIVHHFQKKLFDSQANLATATSDHTALLSTLTTHHNLTSLNQLPNNIHDSNLAKNSLLADRSAAEKLSSATSTTTTTAALLALPSRIDSLTSKKGTRQKQNLQIVEWIQSHSIPHPECKTKKFFSKISSNLERDRKKFVKSEQTLVKAFASEVTHSEYVDWKSGKTRYVTTV
ncbi:hypothetical protein ScalyP_jg901 [Parmales sp. scaly parma]|nr:hypothetical protein ScalyP_jg901 [Parmales sp. scaly parma]